MVLRLVYAAEVAADPRANYIELDALFHDYWARALVAGDWTPPPGQADPEINRHPYLKAPGYPYFLSFIYRVVGFDYARARAVQLAMGVGSLLLLYGLVRRLFDEPVALCAASLYTLCWLFPYYESQFHETASVIFLSLVFWSLSLRAMKNEKTWLWFLAGAGLGLLTLFRPNFLLVAPVVSVGFLLVRGTSRGALRVFLSFSLGVVLAIAPAAVRNYRVSGERVLVSAGSGLNLYIGNNPIADGYTGHAPDLRSWSSFDHPRLTRNWSRQAGRTLTFSEASAWLTARAHAYMRENPIRTAKLWFKKWLLFWGPLEVSVDQIDEAERAHSTALRAMPVRFFILLLLAIPGLFIGGRSLWRRRSIPPGPPRFLVLMAVAYAVYALSFIPFAVTGRYRVPLVPFLLLPAACCGVELVRRVRARNWRPAALLLLGILASSVAAGVNWADYRVEKERYPFGFGLAYAKQGMWAEAERAFRASIDLNPGFVAGWKNYASVLLHEERYTEAENVLRHAREMDPQDPDLWDDSGTLASRLGKWDEAAVFFARGLAIDPEHVSLLLNAGTAAAVQGHLLDAIPFFKEAAGINPASAEAWFLLGRACNEAGQFSEADEAWERAMTIDSDAGLQAQVRALQQQRGGTTTP